MADNWLARRGSKVIGPLPATQLLELAKSGKLLRTDEISRDGGNTWTSAATVYSVDTPRPAPTSAARSKDTSAKQPSDELATLAQISADHNRTQKAKRAEEATGETFDAFERKQMKRGVLGGVSLMAIAVIWFGVGWWLGYIFFNPPFMFIHGLFTLIKGLWIGNAHGTDKS